MQYKNDFLAANQCTVRVFEHAYIKFMRGVPDEQAHRAFARRWGITIHAGLGSPRHEAALSVNIAAIKVLAESEAEANAAIREILQALAPSGD